METKESVKGIEVKKEGEDGKGEKNTENGGKGRKEIVKRLIMKA